MSTPDLIGREDELAAARRFIADASGPTRALVFEGEPGIGKTTLWEAAQEAARATGALVLTSRASNDEAQLGFVGLGDVLDGIDLTALSLPDPQQRAIKAALLIEEGGSATDARAVSAAVLSTLRQISAARTTVVAIDDVAWLDAASAAALVFAARRLAAAPVRFLFTRRAGPDPPSLLERALACESLTVSALSFGAVCRLWRQRLGVTLPRATARRLYETAAGNPLFALELARAVVARGERIGLNDDVPLPAAVEVALGERLVSMTPSVRAAVLAVELAGASRIQEVEEIVPREALERALDAELLVSDGQHVRLAHPLFGATAAARSRLAERREAHHRLAGAVSDPERRAHHLAMATPGQDERAAVIVAAAAAGASRRGSAITAASLGEQALRLTPSASTEYVERLLAAGQYHAAAGNLNRLTELLAPALATLPAGAVRARALLLMLEGTVADAEEAQRLQAWALEESVDAPALRALLLSQMAIEAGVAQVMQVEQAFEWAREAVRLAAAAGDATGELQALGVLIWMRSMRGLDSEEALTRGSRLEPVTPIPLHRSLERAHAVRQIWRGELSSARRSLSELMRLADLRGEVESHFMLRLQLCELELRAGDWRVARKLLEEWAQQSDETMGGAAAFARCSALAAAGCGEVEPARVAAAEAIAAAEAVDSHWHRLEALRACGIAELLAGHGQVAVRCLREVWTHTRTHGIDDPGAFPVAPDLVEALCVVDSSEEAAAVTAALTSLAERQDHPWGRVTAQRCEGLVQLAMHADAEAASLLADAADGYERLGMPFDRARTLTALGVAYRRLRRRSEARAALEQAAEILEQLGSSRWAARAREELARVGGRRPSGGLTPTERRVAELASQGKTNKQIAAELVVTKGSVEHHLTRIYAKLGVRSRTELARLLLSG